MADRVFRWLHLSDLRLAGISRQNPRRVGEILELLADDVAGMFRGQTADCCFFTGNTTARPEPTQNWAEFLSKLPSGSFFFAPGNNDCLHSGSTRTLVLRYWADDADLRAGFWRDDLLVKAAREAFASYDDWSRSASSLDIEGYLPGDFSASIGVRQFNVGIIGLNTAFNNIPNDVSYGVADPIQLLKVTGDQPDTWIARNDFNILLTHFPPSGIHPNLSKSFATEIAPPGRFQLHLCGSYKGGDMVREIPEGLTIQSPSWVNSGLTAASYLIGEADLETGRIQIRHRTFQESHGFHPRKDFEYTIRMPRHESGRQTVRGPRKGAAGPPIVVQRVELENFRCFDRLDLALGAPSELAGHWTCLAGLNGAGKSGILQAIGMVLLGDPAIVQLGLDFLERVRRSSPEGPRDTRIAIELADKSGNFAGRLELTIGEGGRITSSGAWDDLRESLGAGVVVGYGATRNLSSRQSDANDSQSAGLRQLRTLFEPLAQLASGDVLLARHDPPSEILPLLTRVVGAVFEADLTISDTSGLPRFQILSRDSVQAIDLPDGFRSSVAWLADLCWHWSLRSHGRVLDAGPEDVEGIVLIDEIDLHLHPSLQRTLVTRLRAAMPRVQWIVTTHSPLVLANFHSSEIVVLDFDAPGHVRKLDREIMGFRSDEIYEWLMGTRPTGTAVAEIVKKAEEGNGNRDSLAALLRMSPEVSAKEARGKVVAAHELLAKIRPE